MASLKDLPAELLLDVMEEFDNPVDLYGLTSVVPQATPLLATRGKHILPGMLRQCLTPFAVENCLKILWIENIGHKQRWDEISGIRAIPIDDLNLESLHGLWCIFERVQPIVQFILDNPSLQIKPADRRFPWGRDHYAPWPLKLKELESGFPTEDRAELQRSLTSGFICFELFAHMRGITKVGGTDYKWWCKLFGLLFPYQVNANFNKRWDVQEPKTKLEHHMAKMSDLSLVTWFVKNINFAAIDYGCDFMTHCQLPAYLKNVPQMLGTILQCPMDSRGKAINKCLDIWKRFFYITLQWALASREFEGVGVARRFVPTQDKPKPKKCNVVGGPPGWMEWEKEFICDMQVNAADLTNRKRKAEDHEIDTERRPELVFHKFQERFDSIF